MSNFWYVIKYKKRNIKLDFEKVKLNLLNMRRKTKVEKTKLFVQYEKLKKIEPFSQY